VSLVAADLVLEIAAAHILPTIAVEVGRFAFTRAAERRPRGTGRTPRAKPTPRTSRLRLLPPIDAIENVRVISDMPGRARFEVPGLRGLPQRAEVVLSALQHVAGVTGARVSALTGTALVTYDPRVAALPEILRASPSFGSPRVRTASIPGRAGRALLLPLPNGAPYRGRGRSRPVTRKVADGQLPLAGL
jgi:Heavy metal associated domain 2